ncbi:MAG: sulfite exporter TauE/SafE family protein [Armatimonadetes bacterium]|nr:sulfite exporter TauE/SafE family protein [Armatimonadota bacterium]
MQWWRKIRRKSRQFNDALQSFQSAYAKWELENSTFILTRRRKVLLAMLLPVILFMGVEAALATELIGGSKAYAPSFITTEMFIGSLFVGLVAGLITGCIGAGGGFVITPALMSIGVRGIMTVGTDQFHIFAKAIMGTALHRKLGNVNVWLAVWFVVGSTLGVTLGTGLNKSIYERSPALSDAFISAVYVFMLGILGAYALYDYLSLRRAEASQKAQVQTTTRVARTLQSLRIPPYVKFDQDVVPGGRQLPVYPVILCGFIVGFIAAIMGVGGGFLTFPMFVYGLGVSTFTTVGTDILQIIFTAGYASIQYAISGFVFYSLTMGLLLGSLIGVQIGAMVTKVVKGAVIRGFYALAIFAGFVNRACALPEKLSSAGYLSLAPAAGKLLSTIGTVIFFALVSGFAFWVLASFLRSVGKIRAEHAALAGVPAASGRTEQALESTH